MATQTAPNTIRDRLLKGIALQQAGEFEKAQRIYKQAVKKAPNNADAVHLLGVTYRQLGYPKRALEYIKKAITIDPNQSPFYANLARTMLDLGTDPDSLLAVCNKALSLNPREREALNIKGIALTQKKEFEEAEMIFQSLIVEDPDNKDAYRNFGTLLMDANRANHAVNFFIKAVMLEPDNPENYLLRARARLKLKQYEPSQYELTEALERFPENADVKHEAARLLFSMNESNLAVFYSKQAHEADPSDYHKCVTHGVNLLMHGDHKEALQVMKKAKKHAPPNNRTVDWNLALAYLANGDLKNGWELHTARFEDPSAQILRRTFEVPEWKGEDISDKTILVWADQGLGDALKAGTMLPELIELAGKVIIELSEKGAKYTQYCFPEAVSRLARMDENNFQTSFDYDLHVNIGELVKHFRPTLESFKTAPCPVYSFERDRAVEYLKRLKGYQDKPVIGFSWRSKNLAVNRARYYLSAPGVTPILKSRDAIFVNLQYAALDKELNYLKDQAGDHFHNFDDVDLFDDLLGAAALTAACDFVVSANTSVADMAGILDVPAIRFGQQEPPLLLGQKNPPWYPSMTYMHPYTDKACVEFVPEIIKEMDRQLENWTPERRNKRLGL
ncbi:MULTISPECIES: lipopolysaccharide assembly protein LapB [unclassified Roseibium]|jgi:tetratricopeptide (TPR) repeat protein|uniref:tetratricopeptide repeat protein n=1 Tax=unclassified Roseibium TaxID=2629323 RepID=UPI001062B636|nr:MULTISPECIES: tetratricopeptide repeat protein [unclassified Roseibium]